MVFIVAASAAIEVEACTPNSSEALGALIEAQQHLEWYGADDKDIQKAQCLGQQTFKDEELLYYFKQKYQVEAPQVPQAPTVKKLSKEINGVQFVDEHPQMLSLFKKLSKQNPMKCAYGVMCPQRHYSVSPACTKVVCAMEEIFGQGVGVRLLYLLDRYGFNGSHHVYVESAPWTAEELDVALAALGDLPDFLLPQNENKKFTHYLRGEGEERTVGNATISIFDRWNQKSAQGKKYTIVHELGHYLASAMDGLDKTPEWLSFSGWDKGTSHALAVFPSDYAKTNADEDFAESVVTYRYNPLRLQVFSPEKYAYIKKHLFAGLEYINEKQCEKTQSMVYQAEQAVLAKEKRHFDQQYALNSFQECSSLLINLFVDGDSTAKAQQCVKRIHFAASIKSVADEKQLRPQLLKKFQNQEAEKFVSTKSTQYVYDQVLHLIADSIEKLLQEKKEYIILSNKSKEARCEAITGRYVYQSAKEALAVFGENSYYQQREKLNSIAQKVCAEWELNDWPTKEEVVASLKKLLPQELQ
ncbi:MAG: hypothetical protein HQK52_12515 [Oligoflexia bacterium]|nr:hypothetical protein [Oligoflexia bacterium]